VVRYSGRTSWPNVVQAASPSELAALAEANGDANAAAVARRLAPGKILLSRLMARRLRVSVGDGLDVAGRGGTRRFEVVGVTDALGFVPQQMPYRHAKTYVAIAHGGSPSGKALVDEFRAAGSGKTESLMMYRAQSYRRTRIGETDKDFRIFDLMLALTSILAAIGIANQLVLSVRARRRELALYRVLGMSGPQVRGLVILEGGFIGFLGGVLATLLGVPLGYAAVGILKSVSVFEVEFELPPHFVVLTILGSIVVAGIASLYPAGEAKRADAAESVHYE
jgi:putative ABC transport system permease protein